MQHAAFKMQKIKMEEESVDILKRWRDLYIKEIF